MHSDSSFVSTLSVFLKFSSRTIGTNCLTQTYAFLISKKYLINMRCCFSFTAAKLRAEIKIARKSFLKTSMLEVITVKLVEEA